MRRMRDWTLEHYIVAAVPVLVATVGIYHWVHGPAGNKDSTAVIKPSQFGPADRKVAAEDEGKDEGKSEHHGKKHEKKGETMSAIDGAPGAQPVDELADDPEESAVGSGPSTVLAAAANDAVAEGADCTQFEYRGEGPINTKVTKGEWTVVMDQFHAAKRELLGWFEKHRASLSDASAEAMEKQLRALKIQRPPVSDEPDLAWRGIGIYSQSPEGEPIIKLGGGFVHMAQANPSRAKFEMARLVAQVWAPCELQKVSALDATWQPLLKCLGVNESQECGQGTYSESGWAVSTTIAAAVSPPGCQIAAFKAPEMAKCVKSPPFSRTVASVGGSQHKPEQVATQGGHHE